MFLVTFCQILSHLPYFPVSVSDPCLHEISVVKLFTCCLPSFLTCYEYFLVTEAKVLREQKAFLAREIFTLQLKELMEKIKGVKTNTAKLQSAPKILAIGLGKLNLLKMYQFKR